MTFEEYKALVDLDPTGITTYMELDCPPAYIKARCDECAFADDNGACRITFSQGFDVDPKQEREFLEKIKLTNPEYFI